MSTFPPIYVINLKRNPERKLHIQRQMDARGLECEFVDVDDIDKYEIESRAYRMRIAQSLGIDKSLLENKYAAIIDHAKTEKDKNWKNANLGQLAIVLSHIRIYDSMVKKGIEWACILEDDATLLPTFPEVLKIAPELEWDILLFAHYPTKFSEEILKKRIKHIRIFSKDLVFLSRQLKKTPSSQKEKDYRIKRLSEEYGFNSSIYCKQQESFANTIKEYDSKYAEIAKTIMPANRRIFMLEHKRYKVYKTLNRYLIPYIIMQLGALPEKTSLNLITEHHCISEPQYKPYSAAAYLVKQQVAMKWKHEALANNALAIDDVPWELYKNAQAKLRIITPPCAATTHSSFKYSSRLG